MRYTGFHRAIAILHREQKKSCQIHFCNLIETDRLDQLRERFKEIGLAPPSYTALVVKSIALGIREVSVQYPEINSMLAGFLGWKTIYTFERISGGVAIARDEEGQDQVVQKVVQDPEITPLSEITDQLQEGATNAVADVDYMRNCHYLYRAPRLIQEIMLWCGRTFPEMRRLYRGTFALTSVGKFGVDYQITLPQVSCLQFGFGAVRMRPVVRDDQVVPARTFYLTMTFDRRLMNGKPCALLMERIREILNEAQFSDNPELEAREKRDRIHHEAVQSIR